MAAQDRTKIFISAVFAGVLPFDAAASLTAAIVGGDPPPVMTSFTPDQHIQNLHPQPEFTITGSNLILGLPSPTNRPTVTLTHENGSPSFTTLGNVNFTGTTIWLPPGNNELNLLQAPLGTYDLTVTRPDGVSTSLPGAFSLVTEDEAGGDDVYIKHIGQWGGPVSDIDVVGDLAYVANGRMLRILDISDPAAPTLVGAIDLGGVGAVRVRDGYAYVGARGKFSFCVVDVSDPSNPELIWSAFRIASSNAYPTQPEAVFLIDDLAYVLANGWVWAYDISDPHNVTHPGIVWNLSANGSVDALAVDGDRVYVGAADSSEGPGGVRIYDISAGSLNPVLLGSVDAPWGGWNPTTGLAIDGDIVAWATGRPSDGYRLSMVDVSNPAAPVIVSTNNSFNFAGGVASTDGIVYAVSTNGIGDWANGGLRVFDASDPVALGQMTMYNTHASVNGFRVIEDRAYLFDEGEGLIIMDVSNPSQPTRLGNYHSPSTLRHSVKDDDLLFVSDCWHGFTVLNIADPSQPELVGTYQAEHYNGLGVDAFGIDYRDDRIYLGAGHLGLEMVDVADPANPALIGAYRIPVDPECSRIWGVSVDGNVARVGHTQGPPGCGNGTTINYMRNFNISNPANITSLGAVSVTGNPWGPFRTLVSNDDGVVFGGREGGRREIIDSANPAAPHLISSSSTDQGSIDVALNGSVLFTASNNLPVLAQDVTDPANPVDIALIGELDASCLQAAYAVAVQNDRLYAVNSATCSNPLHLFDASDPAAPVLLAQSISGSLGGFGPSNANSAHLLADEPDIYHLGSPILGGNDVGAPGGLAILTVENLPNSEPANPADLNDDGSVNVFDLLILLADWGPCSGNGCPADLNANGAVDVPDLLILLGNWG